MTTVPEFIRERAARIKWRPRLSGCADGMLVVLFLTMIYLPLVGDVKVEETEKRKLAERPRLEWSEIDKLPKQYEAYFNDRFGFRSLLLRINNIVMVSVFRVSPVEHVIIGKNGWLFYDADNSNDGKSIRDHRGLEAYTPEELDVISSRLKERQTWLAERGIAFVVIIAPNKETIYPEYLPNSITRVRPTTRFDQIVAHLRKYPEIPIVDPRPAILAMKPTRNVYYKTDTHWNALGAFQAYGEVMKRLHEQRAEFNPLDIKEYEIKPRPIRRGEDSDIAVLLAMQKRMPDEFFRLQPKSPMKEGKKYGSVLVFGDSFREEMTPFIKDDFKRVVTSRDYFNTAAVEVERPDVVVLELAERYLDKLLL